MIRPNLANFRAQWPSEAMGICQADPKVAAYCNDATERLLMDPMCPDEGWYGGSVTLNLSVSVTNGYAYTVTPNEIARLIVMDVCKTPVRIRNGFYEYLKFGIGLQPKTNCTGAACGAQFEAYERDNVVTLSDLLSTPQTIRIYPSDVRDTGLRVLLQGKDQNGQTILTTDPGTGQSAPGEYLQLAFPFVDSTNQFIPPITGIQKDQTYGPIQFFQVDPTTGDELPLSAMEPNEGSAYYRRYLINGIPNSNLCCSATTPIQITAQGRIDFTPVYNETDYLSLPCIPALIEECQSIRFSRMDAGSAAQQSVLHHARALALLNGQLDKFHGKTNTAIAVPLFGSDRMRASFR